MKKKGIYTKWTFSEDKVANCTDSLTRWDKPPVVQCLRLSPFWQRLLRLDVLPAEFFEVAALTVAMNQADDTGDFLVGHRLLERDFQPGEHIGLPP